MSELSASHQKTLAIVGGGIAGMACAYFLQRDYNVILLEKNNYLGGHTNTITLSPHGKNLPIDTGFMVFNHRTYPNLLQFFKRLGIATQPTDMSFSVNHCDDDLQWNGAGLAKLFSQRKNVFRPRFYKLLFEMNRFAKAAPLDVENPQYAQASIAQYVQRNHYSADFLNLFLIPMSGAIWSTGAHLMEQFPIHTLMRFFLNHGFLGLDTHFQWYTVSGGSQQYVQALQQQCPFQYKLNHSVTAITPQAHGVSLTIQDKAPINVDCVIVASHADEALAMLTEPTQLESELLSHFQYERNETHLHTDASVMPSIHRTWAAWNYRIDAQGTTTHYWMNRLQNLPTETHYFVSLNAAHLIHPDFICRTIQYTHPIFSVPAIQAQAKLPQLNQQSEHQQIFYCGSYFKYGFHEDAFTSALDLCTHILGRDPWP